MEAALITMMSVLAAGVLALAWRIPVQMLAAVKELSDKMDGQYKELSDKMDDKIDRLADDLRAEIREVRVEVSNTRSDLAVLSERVAHIEGRLVGVRQGEPQPTAA